jgi:hypothetical protein
MNIIKSNTFNTWYKNTSILFFALIFFYFGNSPLSAATLTYSNGFESGMAGVRCSGNCPQVTTALKKSGKYSGNFSLTRKMSNPYRTEVVLNKKDGKFQLGKEYWLGLDYRYEDWAKDRNGESAPFQIHTAPSDWSNKKCTIRTASGSIAARATAPIFMSSKNGQVEIVTYGAKVRWTGPLQLKQWLNIVAHFRISSGNDGFIEMWKDGKKLFRVDGPNSPKADGCGKTVGAPYFKMGVYKWVWRAGKKATDSSRRQLFIDNLKMAIGPDGYSLVSLHSRSFGWFP